MAAPKGNRYGVDSGNFFNPKKYTPETLMETFLSYLEDRQDKKMYKSEAIKSGDHAGNIVDVPAQVPLSIESFCVFAKITLQTFINYRTKEGYEELFEVSTRIEEIIRSEQLDGAITGIYHHGVTARILGLADKQEKKVTVEQPLFPEK